MQAPVAKGEIRSVDADAALAVPGVLAIFSSANAPALHDVGDVELALFQSNQVAYRGQLVAAVLAESSEAAREAGPLVRIEYAAEPHDVELRTDHPRLYKPAMVNPGTIATDTDQGDFDAGFAAADVTVDHTYGTPATHNNPMEPHATTARWEGDRVTRYDSNQGATAVQPTVAGVFGLEPRRVHVISPTSGAASARRAGCGRTSSWR